MSKQLKFDGKRADKDGWIFCGQGITVCTDVSLVEVGFYPTLEELKKAQTKTFITCAKIEGPKNMDGMNGAVGPWLPYGFFD